jgi:3-hydroxybutyrate dehydrogenase
VTAFDLSGRTALVTGASRGIGRAIAFGLADAGARVLTAQRGAGPEGMPSLALDLGDEASIARVVDEASALGPVDILVNNAGVQTVSPLEEFEPARFRAMVDLMLVAPFLLARAVLPGMYARGWGRIVNISSVHGRRASVNKAAYVTAKHGLEGLSKTIALEGAPHGVTSNCIAPGYVRTPLVEKQIGAQAERHGIPEDEVVDRILLAEAAIKRLVEPSQVASLAAWLCGPDADMVTGASYTMDGGWSAR